MTPIVDVHAFSLRRDDWMALDAVLSTAERDHCRTLYFLGDRQAYTVCRATLRQHLSARLQIEPSAINLHAGPYGKPALSRTDVHFNVSHSGDWGVIAITTQGPVGIDIEEERPMSDMMGVAQTHFSTLELRALQQLPVHLQTTGFYRCWSRKEAFIKAIGMGLSFPLEAFDVSLDPRAQARILEIRTEEQRNNDWVLHHLDVVTGYCAALVTTGPARIQIQTQQAPS